MHDPRHLGRLVGAVIIRSPLRSLTVSFLMGLIVGALVVGIVLMQSSREQIAKAEEKRQEQRQREEAERQRAEAVREREREAEREQKAARDRISGSSRRAYPSFGSSPATATSTPTSGVDRSQR